MLVNTTAVLFLCFRSLNCSFDMPDGPWYGSVTLKWEEAAWVLALLLAGRACFLLHLKFMFLIGAGSTCFLVPFQAQSLLVQATSLLSLKCAAASSLKRRAATWLQEDPRPAMHVQFAVRIHPLSIWMTTHTQYIVAVLLCLWLGSTWGVMQIMYIVCHIVNLRRVYQ